MANHTLLFSAALAGLIAGAAQAETDAKADVKCYGISTAGHNACGHATGLHSCAGQAKVDKDPNDWVSVSKADCTKAGGKVKL